MNHTFLIFCKGFPAALATVFGLSAVNRLQHPQELIVNMGSGYVIFFMLMDFLMALMCFSGAVGFTIHAIKEKDKK